MNKLYLLKVYPNGNGREVYRKIEITGDATLDDLCRTIIDSFDFIDEHLSEFCMDHRIYSDYSYRLGLQEKQKFLLHYDFGDDWLFTINVEKINKTEMAILPRVIKQKGEIEQYPDVDDWDWEDE